jgi:two-component system response regulator (stage 0 sporulation protein A)
MGTLLTEAIETEFQNPSPTLSALLRKLIREEINAIVNEELGEVTKAELQERKNIVTKEGDLFAATSIALYELGVPAHVKGYRYMRDAVMMVCEDLNAISGVTKKLYPKLAEKYDATPTRVERAIRHAIELSWNHNHYDAITYFFGSNVDMSSKPTNSHYIATIADRLRIERKA